MGTWDSIYAKLPVFAQHAAVSAYGLYWRQLRFGPGYSQYLREYQEREHYSLAQWQEWQARQLRELLSSCYKHVPYYRENWTSQQFKEALEGDLSALPLLEKEPLRESPRQFLREDMHPSRPQVFPTSGSTGTPISSYYTLADLRRSMAVREARSARWAGVSFSLPRATFSSRMVEPDPQSKGPFYRFNIAERQVYYSTFHLRPDTAHFYVDALHHHKIRWLTGYAVSLSLLANYMLEHRLSAPEIRAVITTSEKLTPAIRSVIEKAFSCRVYEEYSTVENAVFASECEHGRLHLSPDIAFAEILRPDGSPCLPDEPGEVAITNFARSFQPLIRFRLGDIAVWDSEPCPCERTLPVIREVIGRIEDVVTGPDGRQASSFYGVFVNQPHIQQGQIIQEALDLIRVKVVPVGDFGEADVRDIIQRVQQRLGRDVRVVVEPVDSIPRTKAGKFQAVISKLKDNA